MLAFWHISLLNLQSNKSWQQLKHTSVKLVILEFIPQAAKFNSLMPFYPCAVYHSIFLGFSNNCSNVMLVTEELVHSGLGNVTDTSNFHLSFNSVTLPGPWHSTYLTSHKMKIKTDLACHWWRGESRQHSAEAASGSCWSFPRFPSFSGSQTQARDSEMCCKRCIPLVGVFGSYSEENQ